MEEKSNYVYDDILFDDVKEIYVFGKERIPEGIKEINKNAANYTAVVVYRYADESWSLVFTLNDQIYDDYQDTCDYIYSLYKDIIEEKGIPFIQQTGNYDSKFFSKENYHVYKFA